MHTHKHHEVPRWTAEHEVQEEWDAEGLARKKEIRKRLESKLEHRRLRRELDDYDEDFE